MMAALGVGVAVPPAALEELLSRIDQALAPGVDLEEWEQVVDDYGRRVYRQPHQTLIPALAADITAVGRLLGKGRPPRDQAGLLRVSAGLSGVLAETLANTGDDRGARRSWSTARRAADSSGDRELQVWVRGRAAQHAVWAGASHSAVMGTVADAVEIAGGVPSAGLARVHSAGAAAAALHGDRNTARPHLDMLERTFDQMSPAPVEQTVLGFQESQLHWNNAYTLTTIGDKRAVAAVERAQALYPPVALAALVNLRLMRAVDLAQRGDLREALELGLATMQGRPRPVLATRQLISQLLAGIPGHGRTAPGARDLEALIGTA